VLDDGCALQIDKEKVAQWLFLYVSRSPVKSDMCWAVCDTYHDDIEHTTAIESSNLIRNVYPKVSENIFVDPSQFTRFCRIVC
jgi:hypothetical protein